MYTYSTLNCVSIHRLEHSARHGAIEVVSTLCRQHNVVTDLELSIGLGFATLVIINCQIELLSAAIGNYIPQNYTN